jgi:hypothetical protein
MTLTDAVTRRVISKLINGDDYRIEIITLIDAHFLEFVIDFFRRIVDAKLRNNSVTMDWYKKEFLDSNLPADDICIHSGLNKKTISNMYNSATKAIVLKASVEHYDSLYKSISALIEKDGDIDIELTIKFGGVSVDLNINESLIVINTLAVKRAQLRGGLWSTVGKQVEKPLMVTLCKLFSVPVELYDQRLLPPSMREVDFYLLDPTKGEFFRCEVKLMGKGNPESADAVIARDSRVFVADKLSDLNKHQLTDRNVEWVELRSDRGFLRFGTVLNNLGIPFTPFTDDLETKIESIFEDND